MWARMPEGVIYTFTVKYLDFILFLILCVDYKLTSKTGRYCNPFQDPSPSKFTHGI